MKRISIVATSGVVFCFLVLFSAGSAFSFPKQSAGQPTAVAAEPGNLAIAGRVVESMNSGGYTYLLLDDKQQKIWIAVPKMEVVVGDELSLQPGHEMGPFTSKTLNRTFDKIIFSAGPSTVAQPSGMPVSHHTLPAEAAAMPAGHPALPAASTGMQSMTKQAGKPATPATVKTSGTVVETFDAGGYTYICLENDGRKSWAAVPPVKVEVGMEIAVLPGMEMGQFTSKTLNRTFDNIIFSSGIVSN